MAPVVQGAEDRFAIGEIEFSDGCEVLADALEVAQVHAEGLEKDALDCEIVTNGGHRTLRMSVSDVEDCSPGAFLESSNRLAAGHCEGTNVDAPLFQDVGVAIMEVGALEAIQFTDIQFSEVLDGIDGKGMSLGDRGSGLHSSCLGAGIDGVESLRGEAAREGVGLATAHLVKGGIAGALEAAFLIGVGLSVSNENDTHIQT